MRWQYLTVDFRVGGFFGPAVNRDELERKLAELAENGWELISAIPIGSGYGATRSIFMILKRPTS
jgi:hypothetical protein